MASHDLQEPLRKIQQFSDRLNLRHRQSLGEDSRLLDRIQESARRMSELITDLLSFSQLSAGVVFKQTVPLDSVLLRVKDTLAFVIEETRTQIRIRNLPAVQGDPRQLEQLFQNLLSNAIKFSSKDLQGNPTEPLIDIDYQIINAQELPAVMGWTPTQDRYHRISVKDNGIGFEEVYAERIFGVFQRLHGKNEFAGTGVGLAICQKIALNHGGVIFAQGRLGQGAAFCIYFPT